MCDYELGSVCERVTSFGMWLGSLRILFAYFFRKGVVPPRGSEILEYLIVFVSAWEILPSSHKGPIVSSGIAL